MIQRTVVHLHGSDASHGNLVRYGSTREHLVALVLGIHC